MLKAKITPSMSGFPVTMSCKAKAPPFPTKSYYVEGGFSHLIHMTAAHLW